MELGEEREGLSESDHEERRLRQVRRHPRPDGREDHEGETDPAAQQRRLLPQHSLQPDLEEPRSQVRFPDGFKSLDTKQMAEQAKVTSFQC